MTEWKGECLNKGGNEWKRKEEKKEGRHKCRVKWVQKKKTHKAKKEKKKTERKKVVSVALNTPTVVSMWLGRDEMLMDFVFF